MTKNEETFCTRPRARFLIKSSVLLIDIEVKYEALD